VDLYSHTHKFFKPNKHTDDYAKQVEVGERRIRTATDMDELDQKVYGGKRVSREDMAAKVVADDSDEEVESYDDEEDMEDEDYDEEMEGESMEDGEDEEIES